MRSSWGKFWVGNGAGSEGDKTKTESPGSYQHLWEAARALSLPGPIPAAFFTAAVSTLLLPPGRPPNPPPSFTADDFTSSSTERMKPPVYTDGRRAARASGCVVSEDPGLGRGSATSTAARGLLASPPSASFSPPVKWVVVRFQ